MSLDSNFWKDIAPGEGTLTGPGGDYKIHTEGEPACSSACPAGVDVKAYVNLIADGRYERAVDVIRRSNPFPGVCGRVCTHPCESECQRSEVDDALAIRALKRFASDYEISRKSLISPVRPSHEEKIAVVGAGPAGLTAAANLAYEGFSVTVFDSAPVAGGIMAWGIPDFRLPKQTLKSEIKDIENLGVSILVGEKVDSPQSLLEKGYAAVILATGCQKQILPGIEGEDSPHVLDCADFLKRSNLEGKAEVGGRVLVLGGGSAALDSARTALRFGADVTIVYRRAKEQMPAHPEEIREAEEEGIKFEYLAAPHKIDSRGKELKALECERMRLGEPDGSGRCRPVPTGEFFILNADWLILAFGSKPSNMKGFDTTEWGTLKVDENGHTSVGGIFAAGDIVSGPASIVEAIGSGHIAARGVISHLTGRSFESIAPRPMLVVEGKEPDKSKRAKTSCIPAESRSSGFDEVDLGYDEISALAEASRCRRCGTCSVCDVCLGVCDHAQGIATDNLGKSILIKIPRSLQEEMMKEPAMRGGWTISAGEKKTKVNIKPLLAVVDESKCIACGLCDDACVYRAIRIRFSKNKEPAAFVDPAACKGCGACAAICPTGAISQGIMGGAALWEQARRSTEDNKMAFSCIWRNDEGVSPAPGEVKLMCTRSCSPALILEALANDAKSVVLMGCDSECHYLPGPWMGADIAEKTRAILEAAGLEPDRLKFVESADKTEKILADLNDDFGTIKCEPPNTEAPLGRALAIAKDLTRNNDETKVEEAVFAAYDMEWPGQMAESRAALEALAKPAFSSVKLTVAHHSCPDCGLHKELLGQIPGLTVIEMGGECGQTGWLAPTAQSRSAAIQLLREAASKGAQTLITDSPACLTHFNAILRGWNESPIEVVDIYSFLLSRMKEGGK